MLAIHSLWTKPRIYGTGTFFIEDFDILTTILSALKWREMNGEIKMVTDDVGYEFYASRNMLDVWDSVTKELSDMPDSIDPNMFWAAGKLYALKSQDVPIASIDTDFIVWDRLAFDNFGELTVIHREEITQNVYPDIGHFKMRRGYIFDPDLDWRVRPVNAAFYVMKNAELKSEYVKAAEEFMDHAERGDNLTYMVFAEQRLLAMTAQRMGIEIKELSTPERLFKDGERCFTHTWGMKQQMREMPNLRHDFCSRCIRRILKDFPEYEEMLKNIPELKKYF